MSIKQTICSPANMIQLVKGWGEGDLLLESVISRSAGLAARAAVAGGREGGGGTHLSGTPGPHPPPWGLGVARGDPQNLRWQVTVQQR